jgi:uncharacterized membrane protein
MPARRDVAVLAALLLLVATAFLPSVGLLDSGARGDIAAYREYADDMRAGEVPYRDFFLEYPPGALPAFLVPTVAAEHYDVAFKLLMLGLLGGLLATIAFPRRPGGLAWGAIALVALTPLLLGPVALTHYDAWPALLVALALALLLSGHGRLGLAALGAATAAKGFAIVLAPLAVAWIWKREGRREALISLGVGALVLCVVVLPFVVVAPGGVRFSLRFQLERPLQIETLGGSLLLAAHHLGLGDPRVVSSYNSENLAGGVPDVLSVAQAVVLVATLIAIAVAFSRGDASYRRFTVASAATLVATVLLGKVLSPQYLVWLLPAVALLTGSGTAVAWALAAGALVLTQSLRLWNGVGLSGAGWVVLGRNLVLAALLVAILLPEVSRRRRQT